MTISIKYLSKMVFRKSHQVCVVIRRCNFYSCWKVEDYSLVSHASLPPGGFDSLANFQSKFWLRLRESFRTVLISDLHIVLLGVLISELPDDLRMSDCEFQSLSFCVLEDDFTEHGGRCIVHVHNDVFCASYGLERPPDEVLSCGRQNL